MKKILISTICILVIVASAFYVVDAAGINPCSNALSILDRNNSSKKMLSVTGICQYPELPTGCESVSATMVLQYYGEDVNAVEFATEWLNCSSDFYYGNDGLCGPDPNLVFAGDPTTSASYGCYAGPIVNAINNNSSMCKAKTVNASSVKELCDKYIDRGQPVLVWATLNMEKSHDGDCWSLSNGEEFTWTSGEHCLVLVGYDKDNYYFNDPLTGSVVQYGKRTVEKRFDELDNQAVVISMK